MRAKDWLILAVTIYIAVLLVVLKLNDRKTQLKHEQHVRQKKLDQQNNIGRRIFNRLDRLMRSPEFSGLGLEVVQSESMGLEHIFQVEVVKDGESPVVFKVFVNLFDEEQMKWLTPIRVTYGHTRYDEVWPADDAGVDRFIQTLENFLKNRFVLPTSTEV